VTLLKVAGITKNGERDYVLQDICFAQRKLQKIAIAGETGSGKSTLLKTIVGLIQPDAGEVTFENEKIMGPDEKLVPGHPGICYLSQHFELPKSLRVEQVLTYANTLSDQHASSLFSVCQIDHLLKRRTDQLSGGEKQRIALAKLLISSPRLLLLDEPFSHLDMVHKNVLKTVIHDVSEKLKITCILVSHDPGDTLSWANKILVMKDGHVVQHGTPEKIYQNPVNEYVAGLFGKYTVLTSSQCLDLFKINAGRRKKNIFVRPENFKIVSKKRDAVAGKVNSIRFYGSYYEVEVLWSTTVITVRTASVPNLGVGDTVYVSLSNDNVGYI
jgi:ABC-type sulfate/molybdate transport systems ATPase subunit